MQDCEASKVVMAGPRNGGGTMGLKIIIMNLTIGTNIKI